MQIFQWIFKVAQEQQDRETTTTDKEMVDTVKKKAESRDLVLFKRIGRGNAKTCFCSTLNLKRLESFPKVQNWLHSLRLKDEDIAREPLMGHNVDLPAHVGKKVLPLCDVPTSASTTTNDQCGSLEKKGKPKGNKTRSISRMKELLRWAATNKSKKGGKYMGQKVNINLTSWSLSLSRFHIPFVSNEKVHTDHDYF
uniref:Uncharacterized protein n=1 Tax=Nelumbo nucifera TaxID=4432 RepID=A0A822Z0H6_NELNU|nr:TPA_asm: hypothetical protein HUJ06_007626 [Nelumbo nucifera]